MVARPPDWPARLDAYLAERAAMPFAWGSNDCVTFAAGWMAALGCPIDLPTWETEAEAEALLAERGGLQAAVEAILGVPIEAPFCGRGDIVLADAGETTPLGICTGPRVALAGPSGLVHLPRRVIRAGWRV